MSISFQNSNDSPRRIRLKQAAKYLGISAASLAKKSWRIKRGIPAIRVGRGVRFDTSQLDAWLQKQSEAR